MKNSDIGPGIANYDFKRFFPHKSWVSTWAADETFPEGYCYKILSVRDDFDNKVELILVRSFRNGTKEELHRARVRICDVEDAAAIFSRGLAEKLGLDFEEQNFATVRSLEEFQAVAKRYRWSIHSPEQNQ